MLRLKVPDIIKEVIKNILKVGNTLGIVHRVWYSVERQGIQQIPQSSNENTKNFSKYGEEKRKKVQGKEKDE